MKKYKAIKFNLPELSGISEKQIKVHLGLYEGYVNFFNKLNEQLQSLLQNEPENGYAIAEVRRRLGFEFNGMRLHEIYFQQFEGSANPPDNTLEDFLTFFGDTEKFISEFKNVAMTRGIGWTILHLDTKTNTPIISWVADHEIGMLAGTKILLALDMWEHAFMVDYTPAEKSDYINAFFKNLNWSIVSDRLS